MTVIAGTATDAGQVRSVNEDRCGALTGHELANGYDAVLVVADGMGGHQAGDVASELVIEHVCRRFQRTSSSLVAELNGRIDVRSTLEGAIVEANQVVHGTAAGDSRLRGMGSTVTAAVIRGYQLFLGHVGDSRAYLIRDSSIHQLSQDHSWVAQQVRAGVITEAEAEDHAEKNVLLRAVGGGPQIQVDTGVYDLLPGDGLLLCSDGLSNLASDDELLQIIRTYGQPTVAAERLVALANARGAPDNVSAVVARVVEPTAAGRRRSGAPTQEIPYLPWAVATGAISRIPVAAGRAAVALVVTMAVGGLAWAFSNAHRPLADSGAGTLPTASAVEVRTRSASTPVASATAQPPTPVRSSAAPSLPPDCTVNCDHATFVSDVTILDGMFVQPRQSFTKTWRVRNSGMSTWSEYQLKFAQGEQMSDSSPISILGTTKPGDTVDISVDLVAPDSPGLHTGCWRIVNREGAVVSGGLVYVQVNTLGLIRAIATPTVLARQTNPC